MVQTLSRMSNPKSKSRMITVRSGGRRILGKPAPTRGEADLREGVERERESSKQNQNNHVFRV